MTSRKKGLKRFYKKRIGIIFLLIALMMTVLVVRVAWIQVVKADEYTDKAVDQQVSDIPLEAKRGNIYDRTGKELATSATVYSVWIRPTTMQKTYKKARRDELSEKLAVILGKSTKSISRQIESNKAIVQIAKYLDKDTRDKVRALKIQGLEIVQGNKRYYPQGTSAAKLLGSVDDENQGRTGIESQFDGLLSGVAGRWLQETDVQGNSLSYGSKKYYQAKDGYNLTLTIDEVIQHYVDKALKKSLKKTDADKIMCIVMQPKTGKILAMETYPSFDPNNATEPVGKTEKAEFNKLSDKEKAKYLSKMWRNPIVSDLYEPGSTFKTLTIAAALESGAAVPQSQFNDPGYRIVSGTRVNCWNHSGHGQQNLIEAYGNSCNPVMIDLALRMGTKTYYSYLQMFGITQKTNVDLPAETSAIVPTPENTSKLQLATMSFGQGVAVTPIQLLTATCAACNGGKLMKPQIVEKVTDSNGKTVKNYKPQLVRKVLSKKTSAEVRDAMLYDVTDGGGSKAAIEGYSIGGKTGTAEKATSSGGYGDSYYASFVGVAPMDDPQIAVLVVIDNPKHGKYGGDIATPVVRSILKNSLPYLGVKPDYSTGENSKNVTYVPDVTGMSFEKAKKTLKKQNLKWNVSPETKDKTFTIKDQFPKAGKQVKTGSTVYLYKK